MQFNLNAASALVEVMGAPSLACEEVYLLLPKYNGEQAERLLEFLGAILEQHHPHPATKR